MNNRDEKLTQFLRAHRPKPPSAPDRELDTILKLTQKKPVWFRRSGMLVASMGTAVAATLLFFLYTGGQDPSLASSAELEAFLEESFQVAYEDLLDEE